MVIFDNDINQNINALDYSHGSCYIEHIRGPQSSSEYKALQALRDFYNNMNIEETLLSKQEKKQYYEAILNDVENNRRKSGSDNYEDLSLWQLIKRGIFRATDFHWHTNKHNTSSLSSVKFDMPLHVSGHEVSEKDVPTNLCLVFNKNKQAYDRCSDLEIEQALAMRQAIKEAQKSCDNITNPFLCGQHRDEVGLTDRDNPHQSFDDNILLPEL